MIPYKFFKTRSCAPFLRLGMLLVLGSGAVAATAQIRYSVDSFGAFSTGWAINNKAQVAGWYGTSTGAHAFLYSDGTRIDLGTLGGQASYGMGINNRGQVVGASDILPRSPLRHAFLYSDGAMTDLSALAGETNGNDIAYGINNRGDVVGTMGGQGFLFRDGAIQSLTFVPTCINDRGDIAGFTTNGNAVVLSGGTLTDLGSLGGLSTAAYGISARGQIVGASSTGTGRGGAFLYSHGIMIDLGSISDTLPLSFAFGINNNGSVVGYIYSAGLSGSYRAFLYEHGQMFDLNDLIPPTSGVVLEDALGINDSGDIVTTRFLLKRIH